jgi:7-cyano-7-deazaguanine synthase
MATDILNPDKALVVLSGGQDSTTCLGVALADYKEVECVTFDYGQRHQAEIKAAQDVVQHFQTAYRIPIPHEIIHIGNRVFAGTSPLTNSREALELYANHDEMAEIIGDRVEKTFVPMRNAVFLTLAANRAVVQGCGVIVAGVCQEDNANYPDCREVFIQAMTHAINEALGLDAVNGIIIDTPLMDLSKARTVVLAVQTPHTYTALQWSHTAYDGEYPPNGHDHASILRAYGFEQSGYPDPLVLRAHKEGLMPLPDTENYKNDNYRKALSWLGYQE